MNRTERLEIARICRRDEDAAPELVETCRGLVARLMASEQELCMVRNVNTAYARENERLIGKRLAKMWAAEQRRRFAKGDAA